MSRLHLQNLLTALDASPRALRRDACGDHAISGKSGHIFANGTGFMIYVSTNESPRRWSNVKQRLHFCSVSQDGDDEGCLRLDRLPTPEEASIIREAIGIRKRRHLSAEERAQKAITLERARSLSKMPSGALTFAEMARTL